jgi:hypothetical protein
VLSKLAYLALCRSVQLLALLALVIASDHPDPTDTTPTQEVGQLTAITSYTTTRDLTSMARLDRWADPCLHHTAALSSPHSSLLSVPDRVSEPHAHTPGSGC